MLRECQPKRVNAWSLVSDPGKKEVFPRTKQTALPPPESRGTDPAELLFSPCGLWAPPPAEQPLELCAHQTASPGVLTACTGFRHRQGNTRTKAVVLAAPGTRVKLLRFLWDGTLCSMNRAVQTPLLQCRGHRHLPSGILQSKTLLLWRFTGTWVPLTLQHKKGKRRAD